MQRKMGQFKKKVVVTEPRGNKWRLVWKGRVYDERLGGFSRLQWQSRIDGEFLGVPPGEQVVCRRSPGCGTNEKGGMWEGVFH